MMCRQTYGALIYSNAACCAAGTLVSNLGRLAATQKVVHRRPRLVDGLVFS
jgi:hypothetical protein